MDHINNANQIPKGGNEHLAKLLGISLEEFAQLRHEGLQEVTDTEAQIYKYFIQFKEDNPGHILDKLDMDANHTVFFSASEFNDGIV
jgi:hypothetical protein